MTVQNLYRVIFDEEEVEIKMDNGITLWYGKNEDMPIEYLEKIVKSIYSFNGINESYIVIEIA